MASSIEERIVQMRFDNGQFEKGAKNSINTLNKLDGVLDQLGSGGGLDKIGSALTTLEKRFSSFGVAGIAAIEHVTTSVIRLAENLITAIPQQIISGGKTRALNIEQAQFQLRGLGVAWEDVSDDIDHAVMGTAYGMDEAAKVASQLAATGIQYKNVTGEISDMGKALRGISGVAAMTNSSYSDIGDIFQTIFGNQRLGTMQLQQFASRGLNVAAKLAEVLSDGPENIKYTEEEIRKMISKGEIDALTFAKAMDYAFGEHATAANETYTGSLSNMKAALSRIGADFSTPVLTGLRDIQNALRDTFNRLRTVTKPFAEGEFAQWMERASKLGVKLAESINFEWLKPFLSITGKGLNNALDGLEKLVSLYDRLFKLRSNNVGSIIDQKALARVQNLKDLFEGIKVTFKNVIDFISIFKSQFTGTTFLNVFDSILNGLGNIGRFLKGYKDLFNEMGDLGKIGDGTSQFWKDLTAKERIQKVKDFAGKIKALFEPLGRIVNAAVDIAGEGIKSFLNLISSKGPAASSFLGSLYEILLKVLNKFADWSEAIRDFVVENKPVSSILGGIEKAFQSIISFVSEASSAVRTFLGNILDLQEGETVWSRISGMITKAYEVVSGVLGNFWKSISSVFSENNLGTDIITIIGEIIVAFLGFRKLEKTGWAIDRLKRRFQVLGGGLDGIWNTLANLPDRILTVLSRLSGSLRALTDNLNAKSLKEIAFGVLILSGALWVLASIDVDKLSLALGAVAGAITALVSGLAGIMALQGGLFRFSYGFKWIFQDIGNSIRKLIDSVAIKNAAKTMMYMAIAVLVLAAAMKVFSSMSWEELAKGIIAVGASMFILVSALSYFSKGVNAAKLFGIGAAMIPLALGMLILTAAIWAFSKIPIDNLVKGILSFGVVLAIIVVAFEALAESLDIGKILAASAAILIISVAMAVFAAVVAVFSFLGEKAISGIVVMAVVLGMMVLALQQFAKVNPGGIIAAGGAMLLIAAGMVAIAAAFLVLSMMDPTKLLVSMIAVVAVLGVITLSLEALGAVGPLALAAAAAILIVSVALIAMAAAFVLLAVGLKLMNGVKIAKIALQLVALVPALILLGAAGIIFGLGGPGLLIGGAGLAVLAVGLRILNEVKVAEIALGLLALAPALILLGVGGLVFGLGGPGMMIGGIGLISLSAGLRAMEGIKIDAVNLAKLGAALVVLGLGGTFLLVGAAGLAVGGPALEKFASALPALSTGLQSLEVINWETIAKAFFILAESIGALLLLQFATLADGSIQLQNFGAALPTLSTGLQSMSDIPWETIGKAFIVLAEGIGALMLLNFAGFTDGPAQLAALGNALVPLSTGIGAIGDLRLGDIGKTFLALAGGLGTLMATNFTGGADLENVGNGLIQIASALNMMPQDAKALINGLCQGLRSGTADVIGALAEVIMATVKSVGDNSQSFYVLGYNLDVGLANGIYGGSSLPIEAVSALASAIENQLRLEMGIHSPSTVMAKLGQYITQGLGNGMLSESAALENATITAISPMLAVFQALANGDYDISPTITPVLDLTNVSASAGGIGGMLGGATIPVGAVSDVSARMDRMERVASAMNNGISQNIQGDSYTINVYPSEGMDEEMLADMVMDRMQTRMVRRGAAFG